AKTCKNTAWGKAAAAGLGGEDALQRMQTRARSGKRVRRRRHMPTRWWPARHPSRAWHLPRLQADTPDNSCIAPRRVRNGGLRAKRQLARLYRGMMMPQAVDALQAVIGAGVVPQVLRYACAAGIANDLQFPFCSSRMQGARRQIRTSPTTPAGRGGAARRASGEKIQLAALRDAPRRYWGNRSRLARLGAPLSSVRIG